MIRRISGGRKDLPISASIQSAANAPIIATNNPPVTLTSVAPPVDDGEDGFVGFAVFSVLNGLIDPVGVYRTPSVFVKLVNRAVAIPVILPAIAVFAPVQ